MLGHAAGITKYRHFASHDISSGSGMVRLTEAGKFPSQVESCTSVHSVRDKIGNAPV